MDRQESMSYYAQHRCFTTEVKEYLYQKLRDVDLMGAGMNPKAYRVYCRIRKEVSLKVGKSSKYGIREYDIAKEYIDKLFESGEYEEFVKDHRGGKRTKAK